MAFVGTLGGPWSDDDAKYERANDAVVHPLQKSEGAQIGPSPAPWLGDNPHDKGGYYYAQLVGGSWVNAFRSVSSADKVWYYFALRRGTPAKDEDEVMSDGYHFLFTHHDALLRSQTGMLCVVMHDGADARLDTHYGFAVNQYDAGVTDWIVVMNAETGFPGDFECDSGVYNGNPVYYFTLEVNMSGGTGQHKVSMWAGDASGMIDGGDTDGAFFRDIALNDDAVISGTPSIHNKTLYSYKGTEINNVDVYEVFVNDDQDGVDNTRWAYSGLSSSPHSFTLVPRGDVPGGGWTPVGNLDPNCATHRWRTLDDPWDDQDWSPDYIQAAADDPDLDQWLELNSDYHGSTPTICGLHVVAACHDLHTHPTHLLTKDPNGAGPTVDVDAGVTEGDDFDYWRYGRGQFQTPDGDPWIHGTGAAGALDDLEVGVRNSHASETRYAYYLFVHVLGAELAQPANAGVCPGAAAARRIFITNSP